MRCLRQFYRILCFAVISCTANAEQLQLKSISYSSQEPTHLAFDLSAPCRHRYFSLSNPHRLVIDLENTRLNQVLNQPNDHPLFANLRTGIRNGQDLRIVIELKGSAQGKSLLVEKNNGAELQFDLKLKAALPQKVDRHADLVATSSVKAVETPVTPVRPVALKAPKTKGRDIIVAIDAGHGGKDIGAQGGNGTQEKDVVFAIAKRLEAIINNQSGMKAAMIRNGDYFVPLNQRVRLAHEAKADLFVSIHADAFNDASARGASVYTLASKGASSAGARWLADTENAADAVGGNDNDAGNDTLVSILHDLSNKAAKEASQNVGNKVLKSVRSLGELHRSAVQKAGFVVLKSPDIPSILVETAFISNPEEENRLNSRAYQDRMAAAMFGGIMAHFRQYAPANTLLAHQSRAARVVRAQVENNSLPASDKPMLLAAVQDEVVDSLAQHTINRGETLSGIAQQYRVSMRALRLANKMNDGNVKIGQVLVIPPAT